MAAKTPAKKRNNRIDADDDSHGELAKMKGDKIITGFSKKERKVLAGDINAITNGQPRRQSNLH